LPFDDLRNFLFFLRSKGEVAEVRKEIDNSAYEISAILNRVQSQSGKAIIFQKIKGYETSIVSNALGTRQRVAMAMEVPEKDIEKEWKKRSNSQWPKPKIVSDPICQAQVTEEKNINLFRYPILKWNPFDGAPYITLGVLTSKDPETNQRNAGIYRLMLQGANQLGINMIPCKGISEHYRKAETKGKPLEIAVAIGLEPTTILAAATGLEQGEDEFSFAGALRNQAISLSTCKSVDLEVPSTSEVVIEGLILPKIRQTEGPFGESTGYYGEASNQPVIKVKTITSREHPIYQTTFTGKPPKEEHVISSLCNQPRNVQTSTSSLRKEMWRKIDATRRGLKCSLTAKKTMLPKESVIKIDKNWLTYFE
jgi:4-hydroxy-3-polyprenylbenzoate decarboxylase